MLPSGSSTEHVFCVASIIQFVDKTGNNYMRSLTQVHMEWDVLLSENIHQLQASTQDILVLSRLQL